MQSVKYNAANPHTGYWQVDSFNNGSPRTRYFSQRWGEKQIREEMNKYIIRSIIFMYNTPNQTIARNLVS